MKIKLDFKHSICYTLDTLVERRCNCGNYRE
nr:MAG TPA: hypothetical protein [Caudoviricetes sp.]